MQPSKGPDTSIPQKYPPQPTKTQPKKPAPPGVPSPVTPSNENDNAAPPLTKSRVSSNGETIADISGKTSQAVSPVVQKPVPKRSLVDRFINFASDSLINLAKRNYNFTSINESSKKELLKSTGNPQLSSALIAASPKFTEIVLDAINKKLDETQKFYKDGLKETINHQQPLLMDCLNATLLKMMANIAVNAKINNSQNIVSFPDMISYLLGVTENHLQYLHHQIAEIEKIQDKNIQKQELNKVLTHVKGEILHVLLPNKAKDIVLPDGMIMGIIRDDIYKLLEDALPDLIIKNYHAVMDPTLQSRAKDEAALKKLPGGDALNALADVLADKLPHKMPGLIGNNIHLLPIQKWATKLFINEKDPVKLDQLSQWLGNSIKQLAISNDDQMVNLWNFSEYYLSPVLKHIFLHMAEKSKEADPQNMFNAVSLNLLSTITTFFNEHGAQIETALSNQAGEEEFAQLFEPLSQKIIDLTGLDKPGELPVPAFLSAIISDAAKEEFPQRLAKLYKDLNPPEKQGVPNPNQEKFSMLAKAILDNTLPGLLDQAILKAPEALSKVTDINEQFLEEYLTDLMDVAGQNPAVNLTGEYLYSQAHNVLTSMLERIASLDIRGGLKVETQPVDLLPNLLVRVITLSKKHLGSLDANLLLRINNLKNLPPDQQEKEKSEIIKAFIPLGDELLKLAGFSSAQALPGPAELRLPLYNLLKDTLVPEFLLDTFQGLTQGAIDQREIVQNYTIEELEPLRESSTALAKKVMPLMQEALRNDAIKIIKYVNESLPAEKLPHESQVWLAQELRKVGLMQSPTIKDGWAFIQNYIDGLAFNAIGSLSLQYDHDHADIERQEEPRDVLKQAALQIIALAANGLSGLDKDLVQKIKALEQLPDEERAEKLKQLAPQFKPLVIQTLSSMGIKEPENLAVPDFVKDLLWDKLTTSILPELLAGYASDAIAFLPTPPESTEGLDNLDRLNSTVNTLAVNLVPIVQAKVEENKEEYAAKIHQAIDKVLPGVLKLENVDSLLNEAIDPKNSGTKKLLTELSGGMKAFITPLIVNIASSSGELEGDVLQKAITNLTILISTEFKDNTELFEAQLLGYDKLTEEGKEERLDDVFGGFVQEAFEMAGIDYWEIPQTSRKFLHEQTYYLYQMFKSPIDIQGNYRLKLYHLMGVDVEKLKQDLSHYKQVFQKEMQPLESLIGFTAEKINEQLRNYMSEDALNLPNIINDLFPKKKMSEADQQWLGSVLSGIGTSNDPIVNDLWNYAGDVLHTALLKLFVDVANQLPEAKDPKTAKELLIPLMMQKITNILGTNLVDMEAQVKKIKEQSKNENERQLAMRELFTPIVQEFFTLAGPDALMALPIPDTFKESLQKELEQKILPDLFAEMFLDITKWKVDVEKNRIDLLLLFRNENPSAAAKALARFTKEILPVVMTDPEKKVAEKTFKAFAEYMLRQPGERAKTIADYMEKHPDEMRALIKGNFAAMLHPNLGITDKVMPATEELIEAIILKSMSSVFTKINQRQNPNLLVDVGLKMIEITNEHCKEINRIMKDEKQSLAYKVDPKEMRKKFKGLHPAIARNPDLSPAKQEELLYNNFLIPMTDQVLKLAGIYEAKDLPVPAVMQEKVFELLKTDLGPLLMETVMTSIDIDKMLLSVLHLINNGIENPDDEIKLPAEFENDPTQQRMNKACGDLFLNMIKMVPNTAVKTFLLSEKIRNLPAESIGKIMRAQLLNTNLLELINEGLVTGLETLSKQITKDEKGNLIVPEDLHFTFAETPEAKAKEKAELVKQREEVRKKLVKELTRTLRDQIVFRLQDFFRSHWKDLQNKIDGWIQKKFGKEALEVKLAIDLILRLAVINVLSAVFQMFAYPFIKLLGFVLGIHLKRKSEQISNTIHLDIHRNLVYKLTEAAVHAFADAQSNPSKKTPEEVIPEDDLKQVVDDLITEADSLDKEEGGRI